MQAVSIGVLALGCLAKGWVVWRYLKREFGWQVYRALGADLKMQRMFFCQQLLLLLVILSGFLFFELWLQLAETAALSGGGGESWVQHTFLLVAAIVALCLCLFAAVQELRWLMYGCIAAFSAALAFFIYKLVIVNLGHLSGVENPFETSRKYITILLAMLLALNIGLVAISIMVAWSFGRGLRQRLRNFQILARQEVDLESLSYEDPTAHSQTDTANNSTANEKYTKQSLFKRPTSDVFSMLVTDTMSSLKESSLLFQAFFSGLDVPTDTTVSSCSQPSENFVHSTRVAASAPRLQDVFRLPSDNRSSDSNSSIGCLESIEHRTATPSISSDKGANYSALQPHQRASLSGSRSVRISNTDNSSRDSVRDNSNIIPRSMSSDASPMALALLLSIEELDIIDSDVETIRSASRPHTEEIIAFSDSPSASWSLVSSISFRTSVGTVANAAKSPLCELPSTQKTQVLHEAILNDDCVLYNNIQQPVDLQVANSDRNSDSSKVDLALPISSIEPQIRAVHSMLSVATSADASVRFGEALNVTMLNEGFDT
ncbi:hypothetical protein COEREDRAFT_86747 [Coemansia reversa NRRL 1564]|uniref:Uncharacterized protein n=1 Tax=Coemansia reversa (strain ATCC 12441 / NRRL 1564) TaxID=763665 RepID=A0A2G5BCC1_COERN|nr:hypothetical protein COEREDRAFT_86747 [Coemansia reversa NRRL 1564]|eukprot:PIA16658.1 hypothetical protein COEREDRAFT_86747 [Coemansia reversa NRRL 1564]